MFNVFKLCVLISIAALVNICITQAVAKKVIFCYWASWSINRPGIAKFQASNIDAHLCTHVAYSFFNITTEGRITTRFASVDVDLAQIKEAIKLKQPNANLKIILSVGGGRAKSEIFSIMAGNEEKRQNFTLSVVNFLMEHHLDGLDLDWEYPAQRGGQPEDYENFITLLSEVRDALKPHKLCFSVAVAASERSAKISYDIGKMSQYVDFINVMTYSFAGHWSHVLGYNAPLKGEGPKTVEAAINYWLREGATADKILLGIPFSGRTFTMVNHTANRCGDIHAGVGQAGPYTRQRGVLSHYEICAELNSGMWTQHWDDKQLVPYAHTNSQWMSYDDQQSIREKVDFVKMKNFGGVMLWSIDLDDFQGVCGGEAYPLLRSIAKVIEKEDVTQ